MSLGGRDRAWARRCSQRSVVRPRSERSRGSRSLVTVHVWRVGRPAVLVALAAIGLAASSSPALAFSQRGHAFGFTFGSAGTGLGQFAVGPAGVAVSESSGNIYVVDPGNQRLEQFGPEGEPVAAWGF